MLRDLIFGLRVHARTPVVTAYVVLTLATGIAATSASFAFLNALFIRPLPVHRPDRLVRVYRHTSADPQHFPIAYREFEDLRGLRDVFAGGTAEEPVPIILGAAGGYERVWGEVVSSGYFSELGVTAQYGRMFDVAEEQAGDAVVVISEGLWRRRFGGDPAVVNSTVRVDGRPYRVAGVAPRAFRGTVLGFTSELWLPIRSVPGRELAEGHTYFTIARLAGGVDLAVAQHALDALARRLEAERPGSNRAVRFTAHDEAEGRVPPPFRTGFLGFSLLGLCVALLVTAVACANAAGVLLAGATARRREIFVRRALGASRRRVVAQLLTEAAVLSIAAGAAGVLMAWQATRLMSAVHVPIARGASLSFDLGIDARTLAAGLGVTVATVLAVGLAPALDGSRVDLVSGLNPWTASGSRQSRIRRVFLGAQVAVSMVLLAGCALFVRSLQHARAIDLGFDPSGVVATAVDTRVSSARADGAFWTRLLDELRRLSLVESASLTARLPLELGIVMTSLAPDASAPADGSAWPSTEFSVIDTGYFETMRIPIIAGRDFTDRDVAGSPAVIIVNDVLARQFWGSEEAAGRHVITRDGGRLRVVGVARRSKYLSVGERPKPYAYFPLRQGTAQAMTIVARGRGDPGSLLRAIDETVRRLNPEAPLYDVTTMSARVAMSLAPASAGAVALGVVAAIAVALTALGLFGAVAQGVGGRTYEIGVRRALGAPDASVIWLMVRDTMAPVAIGVAAGLALAMGLQPALRVVLYDVPRLDALVVAIAPTAIVLVCAVAAWVPSRRATRISAASALRSE